MLKILFIYHLILISLSGYLIIKRLKRYGNGALVDYNLFVLFLSIFYLSVSFCFKYIFNFSLVPYNEKTFFLSGAISAWFVTVYFIVYSLKPNNYILPYQAYTYKNMLIFKMILIIIFCLTALIYIKHFGQLTSFSSRVEKFDYFMQNIFAPYRITILFNISLLCSFFMAYITKNIKWFAFIIPFIILELTVGNRNFMFQSILSIFVYRALINKGKFPFFYSIIIFLFLAFFSIFRESFSIKDFLQGLSYVLAEFSNTRETQEIALQIGINYDVVEYFTYSYMRLLPGSVYEGLFGPFPGAMGMIESAKDASTINFGLGSSIVTDAIFLFNNNLLLIFLYPVSHAFFGVFINYLQRQGGMIGLLIFVYSIGFLFLTMRYGFFTTALIPFYVVFVYGGPIVIIEAYRITNANKRNLTLEQ